MGPDAYNAVGAVRDLSLFEKNVNSIQWNPAHIERKAERRGEFAHACNASHTLMMQCVREVMELPAYGEAFHRHLNYPCTMSQIVHQVLAIS